MKTRRLMRYAFSLALAGTACTQAAELALQGNRLLVYGGLDANLVQRFVAQLRSGKVRTVVFENVQGGTAEVAALYAKAIQESGVNTEAIGQCHAACAYAFLAGKERRFGPGLQVNILFIPVGTRPNPRDLAERWRGPQAQKTLAQLAATDPNPPASGAPKSTWQNEQGVLVTARPTLFGHINNTFYCDGTQGRDYTRCELLGDADPHKLGMLTP